MSSENYWSCSPKPVISRIIFYIKYRRKRYGPATARTEKKPDANNKPEKCGPGAQRRRAPIKDVTTGDTRMYINTKGLVLRAIAYKDSSRIITVLTADEGKLTVSARGAMRRGSKLAAAVQPLAFSDMTLYHSRDRWTLTEAQTIELFDGLSADLKLLALGSYFAELMEAVSDEDSPNPALLNLGLNALFLLSENEKNPLLIKAAFEMRLMCLAGYEPAVSECAVCGRDDIIAPFWTSRAERALPRL